MKFYELINEIPKIGWDWHKETILENSRRNAAHITNTIRGRVGRGKRQALVVSAGPSLYRNDILGRILRSDFAGNIIAIDGSYIQCLKAGIVPDYVLTLDPHPTRVVRWFGDPNLEENMNGDDYFERQDLDVDFRKNSLEENAKNIALVDEHPTSLVICSTSPRNVEQRTRGFERFWFAPLVDNPNSDGITKRITEATGLPALNTGGTVGTTAWVFAHSILQCKDIAVVGMDLGYTMDTLFQETQSYNMLKGYANLHEFYPHFTSPYGECFTDPTYFWYRDNFLDLLKENQATVTNCTGAGMLFGEGVKNVELETWLASS